MMSITQAKTMAILEYHFTNVWLSKSRDERNATVDREVSSIFKRYADCVDVRLFDAECFSARPTDFIVFEFALEDMHKYYFFIEEMRDTSLVTEGLMVWDRIVLGIEDGFREFEEENDE